MKYWPILVVFILFLSVLINQDRFSERIINNIDSQSRIDNKLIDSVEILNDNIIALQQQNQELKENIVVLQSRINVLDDAIGLSEKRKIRIKTIIEAVKATTNFNNPLPNCRSRPTTGELWAIGAAVIDMSDRYAVEASLVLAIIRQESLFCNTAVSSVGAQGYMQLMPATAAWVATDIGLPLKTWRKRDNIHLGTAYISQMLVDFNGDQELAVKAYNGGPTHVKKVLAGMQKEFYAETREYAVKVLSFKSEYDRMGVN